MRPLPDALYLRMATYIKVFVMFDTTRSISYNTRKLDSTFSGFYHTLKSLEKHGFLNIRKRGRTNVVNFTDRGMQMRKAMRTISSMLPSLELRKVGSDEAFKPQEDIQVPEQQNRPSHGEA